MLFTSVALLLAGAAAASDQGVGATEAAAAPRAVGATSAGLKLPAVDGPNAKIDVFGGILGDHSLYGTRGSFSFPLGDRFGVQLDGLFGQLGSSDLYGLGGHAFWRDPSRGLIGLYGSHVRWQRSGGVELDHVAVEGELYRGPITFRALAGQESGNSGSQTSGGFTETFSIRTRAFGVANAIYYPRENLALSGGMVYLGGKAGLSASLEWAMPLGRGMLGSLFIEGFVGSGSFHGLWAGVKLYFAKDSKSLMRRHREDDPINNMPNIVFGGSNAVARTGAATAGIVCPPGTILFGGVCIAP